MKNRIVLLLSALLTYSLIIGCSEDSRKTNILNSSKNEMEHIVYSEVTSEISSITGEPLALNYHPEIYTVVNEGLNKESAAGSVYLSDPVERREGSDPYQNLEVDGQITQGYVLTGIGARIASPSNFTTLHLSGQVLNSNGTLSGRYLWKYGPNKNSGLEAWYEVPAGCVIVGVGMREYSDDLRTLHVHYRQLDPVTKKLYGPLYTQKVGVDPYANVEAEYISNEVNQDLLDRAVLVGVGARAVSDQVTTLKVLVEYIQSEVNPID